MVTRSTISQRSIDLEALKQHVHALAVELPHRGTATQEERKAHDYCAEQLKQLGLSAEFESFKTPASAYRLYILASLMLIVAWGLSGFGYRWSAVLISLLASISAFQELLFRNNLLRLVLPQRSSQNVYAKIAPGRSRKGRLIVMAHVDSHKTPWIWRSHTTFRIYQGLSTLAMAAFLFLPLYLAAAASEIIHPVPTLELALLIPIGIIFLMTLQAERSSYTPGANDNASGAALLLELAAALKQRPLHHLETWIVFTGAEEAGAHGAGAFVRRHGEALGDAYFLVIDNIAGQDTLPHYYCRETMLKPVIYPESMLKIAREVLRENPSLQARPFSQRGAFTDGTPVLLAGFPCLTVVNHTKSGWIPYWHHPDDVIHHIDWSAVEKTAHFVLAVLTKLDETCMRREP